MVGLCSVFAAITISGISKTTMSGDEMLSMVMSNIYIPAAGLFICIKNTLYLHFLNSTVSPKLRREVRKYTVRCALICGAYIAAVTAAVLAFLRKSSNAYLVLYFAGAVFILVFAVLNLDKRKRLVTRNIRINKPRIVAFGMAAVLTLSVTVMQRDVYALTPYIMGVSEVEHKTHPVSYDEDTGVYTITADSGDFRILHLTDIHLGGSLVSSYKDYKALHACYKLIEETKPDLVIVTGDMVFPMGIMSMSLNNQAPVIQFASFMRNVGIPWAFTYGNHDTESMATGTREEICALYRSLSYKSSGNLLYPYVQPDIYGRSNQMIRIENPDGSIRQALFLLDSNDYTGEGINKYDCIHDDQVDWYAEQVRLLRDEAGETVPSMLFFHIPLQEYRTAYELYEQGISEVKYFFGVVGETMINPICCSELPSRLFETAVGLGSTQAMFCGHDHYNNISLEYEGIRLSYGMSIDYLAMPGIDKSDAQRGAELITIHGDSGFDLCQIRLSDIT
ncbi:MAG: metallophosphoesterase [Oscillospiraceae bacterium]|nr:metallophosphoesterase [Oscillospiraceae bacterium]